MSEGRGEIVIRQVLEDLVPDMAPGTVGRAAVEIAEGTATLPLTTRVTLRERLLTRRVSQILHAHQGEPGPVSA